MKILVCIKQVPDMESKFRVDAAGTWYDTADLAWRMNEYDEYAVEQAVRLREQIGESDITVLSVGPERVKEVIKKALAMGCDRGVHIHDDEAAAKEPFQIAAMIARFAEEKNFEAVFTGLQSQDRGSCQVGVLLAEMLSLPCVTTIVDFALADGSISVKRELEGGTRATIKLETPALFTCQLGLNTPRYPTLPNIMKAKKKELVSIGVDELPATEAKQRTERLFVPEKTGGGLVLEGDIPELADRLIAILKEKTAVL